MESPFLNIDYERENKISLDSYNNGYSKGTIDGTMKLTLYLCSLTDEQLLKWKKDNMPTNDV